MALNSHTLPIAFAKLIIVLIVDYTIAVWLYLSKGLMRCHPIHTVFLGLGKDFVQTFQSRDYGAFLLWKFGYSAIWTG